MKRVREKMNHCRETICVFRDTGVGSFLSNYGFNVSFKFSCMVSEQFKRIVIKAQK